MPNSLLFQSIRIPLNVTMRQLFEKWTRVQQAAHKNNHASVHILNI